MSLKAMGYSPTLSGRFRGQPPKMIDVVGQIGAKKTRIPVQIERTENSGTSLASVWARSKIAGLMDASLDRNGPVQSEAVRQVALDFNLISAFTAFVAVDSTATTAGAGAATMPVAVPVPVGVRSETTVPEGQSKQP